MDDTSAFFGLLSQLGTAHVSALHAATESASNDAFAAAEALRRSQRESKVVADEFAKFRDAAAIEKAAIEAQLSTTQLKLSKALKKLRVLIMPNAHQGNGQPSKDTEFIDAVDADLTESLTKENDRLRIRIAELERQREVEAACWSTAIRDLERDNASLTTKCAEIEGKWMERLLSLAASKYIIDEAPMPSQTETLTDQSDQRTTVDEKSGQVSQSLKRTAAIQEDETQLPTQQLPPPPSKKLKSSALDFKPALEPVLEDSTSEGVDAPPSNTSQIPLIPDDNNDDVDSRIPQPPTSTTKQIKTPASSSSAFKAPTPIDASKSLHARLGFSKPPPPELKYQEVVRDKAERRKMHGNSCACCNDFYEAVGHVPPLVELGQVAPASGNGNRNSHLQNVSRHRTRYAPVQSTPEGFWDVGFPSAEEIERRRSEASAAAAATGRQGSRNQKGQGEGVDRRDE